MKEWSGLEYVWRPPKITPQVLQSHKMGSPPAPLSPWVCVHPRGCHLCLEVPGGGVEVWVQEEQQGPTWGFWAGCPTHLNIDF